MTDQQINIAIAEACGIISEDKWGLLYKTASGWVRDCPDYCKDLNAMHEAEKVLFVGCAEEIIQKTKQYTNELCRLLGCTDTTLFQFPHATARQRAEAFLKTLAAWKEARGE